MKAKATLVEVLLLVFVVIILVMIAVHLPAGPTKDKKILKCKANLSALFVACLNYATEESVFPWAGDKAHFWEHWALLVRHHKNGKLLSPTNFVCPEFLSEKGEGRDGKAKGDEGGKRFAKKDKETGEWVLREENVSYAYANRECSAESEGYLAADMDVRIGGKGCGHSNTIVILTCSGSIAIHNLKKGENWASVCGKWLTRK